MTLKELLQAKTAGAMGLELVREADGQYTVETQDGERVCPPTDLNGTWEFLQNFARGYYKEA